MGYSRTDYCQLGEQQQLSDHDPVDGRLRWLCRWHRQRHDPEHWAWVCKVRDVVDALSGGAGGDLTLEGGDSNASTGGSST